MHHAHIGGANTDRIGDKLRKRRRQALAVRTRSGPGLNLALRIHHDFNDLPAGRDVHAARGEG